MAELKPAYLIYGDDHGAIAERRSRLRALIAAEHPDGVVESYEGSRCTPEAIAEAISLLSFFDQRRVVVADGVERWKETAIKERLAPALEAMPPLTTLACFGFEEGRTKVSERLADAVRKAGGAVLRESKPRSWELPRWAIGRAAGMGLTLEREAAELLVAQVGDRRQRITRELEKLAIEVAATPDEPRPVAADFVAARAAHSADVQAYALADAILRGRSAEAIGLYERLRARGERPTGLLYLVALRLRQALDVAHRLAGGEPEAALKRTLRMPQQAAQAMIADAGRLGAERIGRCVGVVADLEVSSRGGRVPGRPAAGELEEQTQALLAIREVASLCA